MNSCIILSIGAELLEGSVVDTNSAFISGKLSAQGIATKAIRMLPDDMADLTAGIKEAMSQSKLVLTTGGLGPTFDDLTAEAMAKACDKELVVYEEVHKHIVWRLGTLGVVANDGHLRQAKLPADAILFRNDNGTAYGFGVEHNGSLIIAMPGVPAEMKPMLMEQLMPFLAKRSPFHPPYRATLHFGNLPESDLDAYVLEIGIPSDVQCIINASSGEVLLKVRSQNYQAAEAFANKVKERFIKHYFGDDSQSPAEVLVSRLKEKGYTLAVAESCTGGLLGGAITAVNGSSQAFVGGVISYSNDVKINQLGVPKDIIDQYGAVSEECAIAMVNGVQKLMQTDCAISVTGIAGPDGGTAEKPVGTVWLALKNRDIIHTRKLLCSGGRDDVRTRSVKSAVITMIQLLNQA
jgi:nicotinamide-nucleotide amidase